MNSHARVVVVGGGCVGVNILHALTKRGWTDVTLLERTELTAGSTWHAAGLIPLYSFSYSFGRMIRRSIEIYEALEKETGQAVGWHKCGQLRVANSRDRMDEYLNYMSIAETQGIHAEIVSPQRVHELWPLLADNKELLGALYHPDDGHIAPADVTQSVAKGARDNGATIHRNTEVTGYEQMPSGEWKVKTNSGDFVCEHVVTATGNYVQQTARMIGLNIPAFPVLHQYWVTEPVAQVEQRQADNLLEMPVLRDETINGYVREERNGLMFGPYERPDKLEHFARDGVPDWFGADLLPENFDAVEVNWEAATKLVPVLGEVGIKNNVRGPICVTPDNMPLVGPATGLKNFWLAEGFSGGILGGGGIGEQLANWIVDGEPEFDLSEIDSRRFGDYANKEWTGIKNKESFGHNFGIHYPGYEWPEGRPSKTMPCFDRLTERGAVWGAVYGWETPLWYAPKGAEAKEIYSYREFNYFPHVSEEVKAVRAGVGMFEMTSMAKYEVSGVGAEAWLNSILANRMPAKVGGMALCHLLTERGGVRAEFTVTRLSETEFYLVGTPRGERHDFDCLIKLAPTDGSVTIRNVTMERGCFTIVGPKARDVLQPITEADLSNETFPWLTAQSTTVGLASDVRMLRVNYEGELGWELYHPIFHQLPLFDSILEAGEEHGIRLAGNRAIESMRLDKSYRAMYRDLNIEYTALESGLDRFVRLDKEEDFIGRDALLKQREQGLAQKMVTLKVDTTDADAYMNEGVYKNNKLVGRVTSGAHSHHFGHCISMAYIDIDFATPGTESEVPLLGERRPAIVMEDSPHDPQNERPRM
ncbi:MAG: FAD-dependent oxidoreductase [Gammaproteobacteria bacterium]|nr:FAD-dependent oxidoreductase [Gammaproteobacteria bacterium]